MDQEYGFDPKAVGPVIIMAQGNYRVFGHAGRDKSYLLDAGEEVMDKLLLDYKDSNLN